MKCISKLTILLVSSVVAATASDCVSVVGGRILAGEIAARVASFSSLDPLRDLGPAPFGSMARIFSQPQLAELLGRGSEDLPETLCVERRREPIPESKWREALSRAVPDCDIQIELRDYPKHRLPVGELQFSKSGFVPGATVSLWRGSLALPERQTIPVWVRAEVRILGVRWKVAAPVQPGGRIAESDLVMERGWFTGIPCQAAEDWNPAGLIARRSLKAGAVLHKTDFRRLPAVQRGQVVAVESGGAARVRVPAVAEGNGEVGESVRVTSSWNGSRLIGRVTAEGKVRVD